MIAKHSKGNDGVQGNDGVHADCSLGNVGQVFGSAYCGRKSPEMWSFDIFLDVELSM